MKNLRLLIAGLLLSALLLPSIALHAQAPSAEFESESGLIRFEYPANWFVDGEFAESLGLILISNNRDYLRMADNSRVPSDTFAASITLLTPQYLEAVRLSISPNLSAEDLAEAVLAAWLSPNSSNASPVPPQVQIGEISSVEVDDEREIGLIATENKESRLEGLYAVFTISDLLIIITADVYEGDLTDYSDALYDLIASFEFVGTSADLPY